MGNDGAVLILVAAAALLLAAWPLSRALVLSLLSLARRRPGLVRRFGDWAREHPLRARFRDRFPRLYGALAARLTPHRFGGLPLTLIAVAAVYMAALFGGLVADLRETAEVERFDAAIDSIFEPMRQGAVIRVFLWITTLGDSAALTAVSLAVTGLLWALGRRSLLVPLWVVILGSQATTWIGKFVLERQRPDFVTAATALSPSFPSAHSSGALAVYGFLAYAVARDLPQPARRYDVAYWTLVVVALVAVSRVLLSVHFASDVAGGLLVGGFWLLVGFTLAEWRR